MFCSCWCDMSTAQVWAFFVPILVVFFITGILAEATASDDYKLFQNTDLYQLNWSLKCDSSIMFLAGWTMFAYFIGLVAMDQQAVWVFVIFELFNLILGPAVFVVHTMGHYQVAKPMHHKFPFLPFYKDTDPPDSVPNADKPKNKNIDPKPETEEHETDWQQFWSWVTNRNDRNIAQESEDVLFRKVPR
uniref:Uncharacterized protein n=1 Tax=Plectus sambesii TaxID=2011161 RepID=A0A914UY13_9BILA